MVDKVVANSKSGGKCLCLNMLVLPKGQHKPTDTGTIEPACFGGGKACKDQ